MLIEADPQDLVDRLSRQLHPHDVQAFNQAAAAALHGVKGDGLVYRTVTTVWRAFFVPPPDERNHVSKYGC